ncbi:hypothetical protein FP2506_11312 [Fulvimarina pelagi HTCC2506]|uniref:Phage tail protein n=1 Tax=Fulvimarina pelagi HTCC2506 TaxID=314231 RepID=Q0FZ17_9HYPH|nr:tail protein X [Fulvimarina pelagi]EAU40141.1 hypothetical protein FP2506_11312 [Fulvimarina pelagi HTCC2506]
MIMIEDIRIDRLAKRVYGTERGGTVEAILDANVGLAALIFPTGVIPAGADVVLPEVVERAAPAVTRPWD